MMPVFIQEAAETGVNSQAMSFEAGLFIPSRTQCLGVWP